LTRLPLLRCTCFTDSWRARRRWAVWSRQTQRSACTPAQACRYFRVPVSACMRLILLTVPFPCNGFCHVAFILLEAYPLQLSPPTHFCGSNLLLLLLCRPTARTLHFVGFFPTSSSGQPRPRCATPVPVVRRMGRADKARVAAAAGTQASPQRLPVRATWTPLARLIPPVSRGFW
jgi:hypothetical protein